MTIVALGPFRLDTRSDLLLRGTEPVALGQRAIVLLRLLVERPGELVSKDALIEIAWSGRAVEESNLTVQIAALRRVLGSVPNGGRWIETLPRRGYRFIGPVVIDAQQSAIASPPQADIMPDPAPAESRRSIAMSRELVGLPANADGSEKPGLGPPPAELAWPVPDKPSIAVLPFDNLSGDPEQEYFADGIAEDIITALSRIRRLFVTARNSSFTFKGGAVDVRRVGRDLGVRYVLEGSTRKAGNRVRVTAQLVDAGTGGHVWAERYDYDLADLFAVQDDITRRVSAAIAPAIAHNEGERAARRTTASLSAWEAYHRGSWHREKYVPQEYVLAKACYERAIELDPGFAAAHADLAWLLAFERTDFAYGPTVRAVLEAHALDLIQRAIALDPAEPMAHTAFALILMVTGRHQESLEEADLAVSLAPNSATAHGQQGAVRLYAGRPHEGLEAVEMAMRLSPLDPLKLRWLSTAARAHYCIGNYQQAITVAQGVCRSYPRRAPPHLTLVAALGQTGQIERAQSVVQQARRTIGEHFLQPGSASHWPEQLPEHRAHLDEGLRKAGFIR